MYFEVLQEVLLTLAFQYILQPWNVSCALSDLDGIKEASTALLCHIVAVCRHINFHISTLQQKTKL